MRSMSFTIPTVSVIIPTHNRSALLKRTLDSLSRQDYPLDMVEVIVGLDGCTDDSRELLLDYRAPFKLCFVEQERRGSGAARNHAAQQATGEFFLFLDDDIEAFPFLISEHIKALHSGRGDVVMGYLPPKLSAPPGYFRSELQEWWISKFRLLNNPVHRFEYTDFLSGNFSISSELFFQIGQFNETIHCHEDYELAYRLIQAGATFVFAPYAIGYHIENTRLKRSFSRKENEGKADVLLGELYPELCAGLLMTRLFRYPSLSGRVMRWLAFYQPRIGDILVEIFCLFMNFLEFCGLRGAWKKILYGLLGYHYWKGISQRIATIPELQKFIEDREGYSIQESYKEKTISVDIQAGLKSAELILDKEMPHTAFIHYGPYPVGEIHTRPGMERIRGKDLGPILAMDLVVPTLRALALAGEFEIPELSRKLLVTCNRILEYERNKR